MYSKLWSLLSLAAGVAAMSPPGYGGFALIWSDQFNGGGGSLPNGGNWNFAQGNNNANGELEYYTSSNRNVQLSGGGTVQIVPWRDGSVNGGWTSARLESKYTYVPQNGEVTRLEARIRMGTNPNKQGIWPAFWTLGDAIRHGTSWPQCGELDILEQVNGKLAGYGTMHCDVAHGGICNEPNGLGANIGMSNDWHTWRLEINKQNGNWRDQTIQWSMDGQIYHTISGGQINNQNVWNSVANSPFYFILNVAVGGGWPGYPDGSTQDGYGSMMEVGYVAHYTT